MHCKVDINEGDLNVVAEFSIEDTQGLLNSTDTILPVSFLANTNNRFKPMKYLY